MALRDSIQKLITSWAAALLVIFMVSCGFQTAEYTPYEVEENKANAAKQSQDPFSGESDGPDPSLELIQATLDEFFNSWEEYAVEDVNQVVKDEVSKMITEWGTRPDLVQSKEALDSLTWQIVALTDDLIHAALNNPDAFRNRLKGKARH